MRLIETLLEHPLLDTELPIKNFYEPLGFDTYIETYEAPLDEEDEGLEAFDHYARDPQSYIDTLPFPLPKGFVEGARYENEDFIILLALKPLTPLAELLLAQQETGEELAAVARERRRQVEAEGWSADHDDTRVTGELAAAAASYAAIAEDLQADRRLLDAGPPASWPFDHIWWKPSDGPRGNLIKSAALTLAEMERLARAAPPDLAELQQHRNMERLARAVPREGGEA